MSTATQSARVTNEFPLEAVRAMPKAELHVHLEGTVDAATLLDLCERHDVVPPAADAAGVDAWYRFDGFPMFLERYFTVLGVLREPSDFSFIAERYLHTAHSQGVVHVEFHVSATGHILEHDKRWAPIHDGIVEGCQRAANATGVSWGLIPDISPHLPATDCARAMDEVFAHDLDHIVAIGMGGPADSWFTDDYSPMYAKAALLGIPGVAHAGEHGGPEEVRFALEEFNAVRIQHGIGAMGDSAVVQQLIDARVACDVCPRSNVALAAVGSEVEHPLPQMLEAGITVTIGTDDPPMFQTNLLDDYRRAWDWCSLDVTGITALVRNSIDASFASTELKQRWLARL